jgi:hypothetical protein|tara:strand:+ start:410 stop:1504 length:1095 start_codon:yes stop_codon:yes gene_type:complete
MKSLYVGQKQALIFPVLCDGYVKIDYSDQVANNPIGIFGYDDSFTIQTIVTPYDLNGNGYKLASTNNPAGVSGIVDSVKTFPNVQDYNTTEAHYQNHLYSADSVRVGSRMTIFQGGQITLSLVNATTTTQNQPAEYKIEFIVDVNGTDTLTSDFIITSKVNSTGHNASANVYDGANNEVKYVVTVTPNSHSSGTNTFTTAGTENNEFFIGQELFTRSGQTFTSIGTITNVTSSAVTMSGAVTPSISGVALYTHNYRETPYVLTSCHIAASFDAELGTMKIYYDGKEIATKTHSSFSALPYNFAFPEEDMHIGQWPLIGHTTQFFGEIHEFAILKGVKKQYDSLYTLAPRFDDILVYYRFEEVDL